MHTCNTWEVQNHLQQCTLGALTLVCLICETFTGRGRGWVWISSTTPFAVVPFCAISCQHYNPGPPALSAQPTDGLFITTWSSSLLTSQLRRTQLRPCQQSKSWSERSYFLSRNISCNLLVQCTRFSWIMCKSGDHMARTCCKVLPVVFLVVAIKTAEQHLNSEVTIWQRYTVQFDILLRADESRERVVQLSSSTASLSPANESNESESILLHNIYIATQQALICSCRPIWTDRRLLINCAKVLWVVMFLAKLVFAPGPVGNEWSWTHANKCFCSWGQSRLACCGLALIHSLLLFPLRRFLSLFMSKFN